MNDLLSTVDWSRGQFALTAMVHWLFVPLTIGLSLIVAIMESIYLKTKSERWKRLTKFWMLLFGINFACGVATGIILEFEFGTNWSNYSWFVGDIFGAPLAIEGIAAFFLESTFIAVMFFGWNRVSPRFHLLATWLTSVGVCLSAYWILVANAWMQYPAGMEFDPAQMRNVMVSFSDVALSPVAVNKFFHTVLSGWVLGAVFVVGVSCWFICKKSNLGFAKDSIKIASWVGLAGIVLTMWTGDGSAVEVAKVQPMKLAAMEGLYDGSTGQSLVGFGILDPSKQRTDGKDPMLMEVSIPKGLSILATHNPDAFIPGINDLIEGRETGPDGQMAQTLSYAERIEAGKRAQEALRRYDAASSAGDKEAMEAAERDLKADFGYFGYGYLSSPDEAVPPVALTFYAFRVMVMAGGYLLLFFIVMLFLSYRKPRHLESRWLVFFGILTIPVVWIASEAGWIVAEMGRQPWVIQDLLPTRAAVSAIPSGSVQLTFWMFVIVFAGLMTAEVSIMCREISKASRRDILAGEEA
ncbi:MAG: cytochrome ubiquinol oxidase subunit I [Muribaculaceae bacterium]|jgi:cytochrome d ubiquinol oxidase subunit I